jgi:hypothetical protein
MYQMIRYLLSFGLLVCITAVFAADDISTDPDLSSKSEKKDRFKDRFYLRLGTYVIGHNETTLSITSPYILGINLDINRDLNMEDPGQTTRIDGYYRFKEKHALGFSYYQLNSSGSTQAGRIIYLPDPNDPQGEIEIPVGADVESYLDTEILKLNYIWSFYRSDQAGMALNLGLHITRLEAAINGQLVVGDPLTVEEVDVGVTAPLPVIGGRFSYKPSEKLRLILESNIFFLSFGDYSGSYVDTSILAEYRFWKHAGIGGGFNFNNLQIKANDSDTDRRLDLHHAVGAAQLYFFLLY